MKKYLSKKVLVSVTAVSLVFGVSSATFAASTLKKITAYQNAAIKVEVDGQSIDLSSSNGMLYPIVYNGNSYVPAKAVAEALGATVKWNGNRQAVEITSSGGVPSNAGIPYNDNSSSTPSTSKPSASTNTAASSNKGTMSDPVKLGSSFTYTDSYNAAGSLIGHYSAQYTFSISKVTSISRDQIEKLGFRRPEENSKINYVLLDVNLKVKNAVFKKYNNGSDDYDYHFLNSYRPSIWGVKTASGDSIIGGTDHGFDGSLSDNISKIVDYSEKVYQGDSKSYETSGKILLPVISGQENLFTLQRSNSELEYDDTFIYFKLK